MLKDLSREELDLLSYTDLTYRILKEAKKTLNTPTIFKQICNLLGFTDAEYANKIGNYYTSLTLDKRFIMLDSAEWDLRERHSVKIEIDDDDDELIDEEELEDEEEVIHEDEVVEDEEIEAVIDDEELDEDLDELEDLTIINEDEIE
jgi:DNA-directed RNA polymerase subunit delta